VHGQEQEVTLGGRRVLLYPIYHPAAALYTPRMLEVLKDDFARLPELMGREAVPPVPVYVAPVAVEPAVQLGLF
jgi:DNA polymerase